MFQGCENVSLVGTSHDRGVLKTRVIFVLELRSETSAG